MQKQKKIRLQSILLANNNAVIIFLIYFLSISSIVSGQDKRYQIADYGLTFYYDTTDNGIAKTVYGNRYIRIYYLKDNLLRVECYRSSDSSIIEKGNYIVDSIPRIKTVKGKDIDTGTSFTESISYYELKRRGLWCFYNKRKVRKIVYE